jgi:hypothetical protein
MPAGALPAGVVEQPLRDVLPDGVATVKPDRVDGLDFHGALAPATRDAQHVALDLREPSLPHLGAIGLGARVPEHRIQKRAGKPITAKERPRGENVVDLMDALRKSIGGAKAAKDSKPAKKPRKVASGQKEMLMPIAGKKPAKEAAAKKPAAKPQRKSA